MAEIKQVIVLRDKFPDGKGGFIHPRKGKLVAQGAHASMKFLAARVTSAKPRFNEIELAWLKGSFAKICVRCQDEVELLDIYERAKAAGLETHLIVDSGLTEFNGVPTKTALAIGPDLASKIDPITGNLTLL